MALSVKHNVSDLHLCSGCPPCWRQHGQLTALQQQQWRAAKQVDFALTTARGKRLRAGAFARHGGGISLALRLLPQCCPQLKDIDVPAR